MKEWFNTYGSEITWFIIGWLAFGLLDNLAKGNFGWALVDAVLIFVNFKLRP